MSSQDVAVDGDETTKSDVSQTIPDAEKEKEKEKEQPVNSTQEGEDGSEDEAQGGGENGNAADAAGDDARVSSELYKGFRAITEALLDLRIPTRSDEGHFPSTLFKRLPNKRNLPDYYEVVKEPSAISTLRGKIQRKQYTGVPEFVRDFALIVHNAQIYNRPNSAPVRDVLRLDALFKEELQKLVEQGLIAEAETKFPDLGEIPYATPEPDPKSEEEEGEEEADEEDEEEEAEDSDDDRRRRRGRRGGRTSRRPDRDDEEDDEKTADAESKRRGRPPKVDTPLEARIKNIMRGIRKVKSDTGVTMAWSFEKLPDKYGNPLYYQVTKEPVSLDTLKRKSKRKKYSNLDEFMRDVDLMFRNAMDFNEDGSEIYNYAKQLLAEAKRLEVEEKSKPDTDYIDASEGRLPVSEIVYKNEVWRVGDWIHIRNENDVTKPIVGQIFRTWKTTDGEEWINACWYYRPEQTVHQFEKHFWPNEVVKTGQYRDHKIEEVVDKCFVMFFTRFGRGRPRGIKPGSEVYVCEARYNEDKFKFNKIKTWASCLPDEVRDKDYEMDLFDVPHKIKKVPSPLKHLLKDNTKPDDALPQPRWGDANAPPLEGGIHRRPREENQTPPPEPTPPPQIVPTPLAHPANLPVQSTPQMQQMAHPSLDRHPSTGSMQSVHNQAARPLSATPQASPYPTASQPMNTPMNRPPSQTGGANHTFPSITRQPSQSAVPVQPQPYIAQQQLHPAGLTAVHPQSYTPTQPQPQPPPPPPPPNYGRPPLPNIAPSQYNAYPAPPPTNGRGYEAFVLSDAANDSIPKEIRDQFPQDNSGHVLFFTQPPLDTRHFISGSSSAEKDRPLQHSEQYMKSLALRKRKRGEKDDDQADTKLPQRDFDKSWSRSQSQSRAQINTDDDAQEHEQGQADSGPNAAKVVEDFATSQIKKGMVDRYKLIYGREEWRSQLVDDLQVAEQRRLKEIEKDCQRRKRRDAFNRGHLGPDRDTHDFDSQGYLKSWQKNFFTGVYRDDVNPRLPF